MLSVLYFLFIIFCNLELDFPLWASLSFYPWFTSICPFCSNYIPLKEKKGIEICFLGYLRCSCSSTIWFHHAEIWLYWYCFCSRVILGTMVRLLFSNLRDQGSRFVHWVCHFDIVAVYFRMEMVCVDIFCLFQLVFSCQVFIIVSLLLLVVIIWWFLLDLYLLIYA